MTRLRRLTLPLIAALLLGGGLPACGEDDVERKANQAEREAKDSAEKAKREAEKAKDDVDGE